MVDGAALAPRERIASVAYAAHAWGLSGNAGTTAGTNFIGTTDGQALEFRVNGARAYRIEPAGLAPNIVAGRLNSASSVTGAVIGGGANNLIFPEADYAVIGGGSDNSINTNSSFSIIGGGFGHVIDAFSGDATIGGGLNNSIGRTVSQGTIAGGLFNTIGQAAFQSTVGGGRTNTIEANSERATIAGGHFNIIRTNADYATIGGGESNSIGLRADHAVVPGGRENVAAGTNSFAAGRNAQALHNGAFVWADSQGSPFASTSNDQFLVRASGGVGIGTTSPAAPLHVADGSAGSISPYNNTIAAFESDGNTYVSVLAPDANEAALLFGSVGGGNTDAGVVYNAGNRSLFLRAANDNAMTVRSNGFVGVNTATPATNFVVFGSIKHGSSGQFFAPSAHENLRMLRGRISSAGSVQDGLGFSALNVTSGHYRITYSNAFADIPSVAVTVVDVSQPQIATLVSNFSGSADLKIWSISGNPINSDFHFIAAGPR
jgi:hypothetical protein